MPRVPATLDHAQAALSAARGAGLAVERAEVARVASNVLVRLAPGPFAARLTGATEGFRDSTANLRREARIAAALAAAGAPVPAPLGGPYEAGGRAVTLWPWVEVRGDAGDAEQAGSALRACHDALADLDRAGLELEPLAMLTEARRLAAGALPEILPAVDHALATLGAAPHRIVHGDSHPGNVLWTAGGPLWSDWEDAHLAPLEWDLGCLVSGHACAATTSAGPRRRWPLMGARSTRRCSTPASTRASRRGPRTWRRRVAVTPRRFIDVWTG